jgi:hypothetical protein
VVFRLKLAYFCSFLPGNAEAPQQCGSLQRNDQLLLALRRKFVEFLPAVVTKQGIVKAGLVSAVDALEGGVINE